MCAPGAEVTIGVDDPRRADVRALIAEHLADMRATSPAESVHALDTSGLTVPEVVLWSARVDGVLLGCAALKDLGDGTGEVKSMRTASTARRRGVARLLLVRVIGAARDRGLTALLLETGSQDFFAPARALYAAHGFVACGPFADYRPDPNSVFLRLQPL